MLSDGTISKFLYTKRIEIDPHPEFKAIQPSSVDLRLGNEFRVFDIHDRSYIDPLRPDVSVLSTHITSEFYLHPGSFVLATTIESINIPRDIVAVVNGKSSLGRLGLLVHATAGFIDPGFSGRITLELSNVAPLPIKLTAGMYVCQIAFDFLDKPCERPYGHEGLGSRYQNQNRVGPSLGVGSR